MHAEVLARKAFVLYIAKQVVSLLEVGTNRWLEVGKKLCKVKKTVDIALVCSKMPCGDMSILKIDDGKDGHSTTTYSNGITV